MYNIWETTENWENEAISSGFVTRRLYFKKKRTLNGHFSRPAETDPYVLFAFTIVSLPVPTRYPNFFAITRPVPSRSKKNPTRRPLPVSISIPNHPAYYRTFVIQACFLWSIKVDKCTLLAITEDHHLLECMNSRTLSTVERTDVAYLKFMSSFPI